MFSVEELEVEELIVEFIVKYIVFERESLSSSLRMMVCV